MDMQNMRERFLDVFLEEWKMFVAGAKAENASTTEKREGVFDAPVMAGELRIFADCERQLVGLLYKHIDDAWVIIPVSEFTVPATEQEVLIGKRVYQLWNSFTAQEDFVERSWFVDDVALPDLRDLNAMLLHVMVGDPISNELANCTGLPITSLEDPRLAYEREFVIPEINNEALQKKAMKSADAGLTDFAKNRIWATYGLDEYRLAAATQELTPAITLIVDHESWKGECRLVSQFAGFDAGDKPKRIKFVIDDPWFNGKLTQGSIPVNVYKRSTKELVGTGMVMSEDGENIARVQIGNVEVPVSVEDASDLVLILARE